MIQTVILLALVTAQRLGELVYARANERALKAKGAVEVGAGHYPLIVLLHASWLVSLWAFGWRNPLAWGWTGAYVLLQVARGWVLGSIGRRWTTRVWVVPGEALVRLSWASGLFGVLNLLMLAWRIRVENRALAELSRGRGSRRLAGGPSA